MRWLEREKKKKSSRDHRRAVVDLDGYAFRKKIQEKNENYILLYFRFVPSDAEVTAKLSHYYLKFSRSRDLENISPEYIVHSMYS